jgi:peptidoglycan/xylan/chitin deacetylase (PgdA/CDA1 family)
MTITEIPIINYHKIEQQNDFGITSRRPADFKNDLDFLLINGYTSVTFSDLQKPSPLPEKPIIITFDDAYESFYSYALEPLLKRNMRCIVYVPVNFIGKSNDWDAQFKKKYIHLNEQQLYEISKLGIETGSHSLSHRYLNLMNNANLIHELSESKNILQSVTNSKILSVSYPFGRFNRNVLEHALKFYSYGVQLLDAARIPTLYKHMAIKRINIYRYDTDKSLLKKLDYHSDKIVQFKNKLVQAGSWATIINQTIKAI